MGRSIFKQNRLLHLFSGEDRGIINELDNRKINRNFNFIGLFVIVICIICFVSAVLFMLNVFQGVGKIASLPIGIFWGFTVTTIYVLLLYTITPPLLIDKNMLIKKAKKTRKPHIEKAINSKNLQNFNNWLTVSMLTRLIFIIVFAVIVAQPINVILFTKPINDKLELYKSYYKSEIILNADVHRIEQEVVLYEEFLKDIHFNSLSKADSIIVSDKLSTIGDKISFDSNFLSQSQKIQAEISLASKNKIPQQKIDEKIVNLNNKIDEEVQSDNDYLNQNLDSLKSENIVLKKFDVDFKELINKKEFNNSYTIALVDNNNFYMRRIVIINTHVLGAWIVNLFFMSLFIIPISLKFNIRKIRIKDKGGFYPFKKKYEEEIVQSNYSSFKAKFEKNLGERLHLSYIKTKERLQPHLAVLEMYKPLVAKEIKADLLARYYPYVDDKDAIIKEEFNFSNEDLLTLQERNKIVFYEKYLDPPFNLKKREDFKIKISGQQLIDEVWSDE
ncbi:DUF4407 domain-containing protein [Chryseobacterium salivictor]|uniref:DUF4407 domain-containing protein n=1 Tax=Chryseobacterium salivictor TaxID=2547600 RepID=A0A4P6ZHB8_9FLAO|nr:DUF4407 domain-containing protein [Chryseobacterium salivictor]QBO58755.1 hypothetical protein NBC122_01947 [Chryseobacterium salivictor]